MRKNWSGVMDETSMARLQAEYKYGQQILKAIKLADAEELGVEFIITFLNDFVQCGSDISFSNHFIRDWR